MKREYIEVAETLLFRLGELREEEGSIITLPIWISSESGSEIAYRVSLIYIHEAINIIGTAIGGGYEFISYLAIEKGEINDVEMSEILLKNLNNLGVDIKSV